MSGESGESGELEPGESTRIDADETQVTHLSTMRGGKAASIVDRVEPSDGPGDLARAALAGARGLSRAAGRQKPGRKRSDSGGGARTPAQEPPRGGFSGPAPDATDPELVGSVLEGYVADRGWHHPLASARVFTDWAELVGADVAAHCRPAALTAGELTVEAESTAWATQLRLLTGTVLARLVAQLGAEVVTAVRFRGPTAPSWKHGGRSVRGARGPRDTYG